MDILNLVKDNIGLIIISTLVVGAIIMIRKFLKKTNQIVKQGIKQVSAIKQTVNDISNLTNILSIEEELTPKSVGGATSIYLKKFLLIFRVSIIRMPKLL